MRSNIWKYANFLSDTCVLNDQSSERIRVSLEQCNFTHDLNVFIDTYGTGTQIPEPHQYTPYDALSGMENLQVTREAEYSSNLNNRGGSVTSGHQFGLQLNHEDQPIDTDFLHDSFDDEEQPTILFEVIVLYDYKSQSKEELDIVKDQVIPVVATHEDGWWEGLMITNGIRQRALFPSNFTRRI